MSLVSLITIVTVVVIVVMFASIVFLKPDAGEGETANSVQPTIPEQTENGTNKYPSSGKKKGEGGQQREEEKEISISKADVIRYAIEDLRDGEDLKFEMTFTGSSSGFSAGVGGKVLDKSKTQIYEYKSSAKGTVKAKEGMELELYAGCMYNTQLKINDKDIEPDDSIMNSSGATTLESTIAGDSDESSK